MMDFFKKNSDRIEDGGVSKTNMSDIDTSQKITKQIYFNMGDKEVLSLHRISDLVMKQYSQVTPYYNHQLGYIYKDYCIKLYKTNEGFHAEHIDNYSQHTNNRIFACIWYLNSVDTEVKQNLQH